MNTGVGRARIGEWYVRWDKGLIFQVTGIDERSKTVEIQTFDGDVDEMDAEIWTTLPLGFAEPPEDWTGPVDNVEADDLGYSESQMAAEDWAAPLQPLGAAEPTQEQWEDASDSSERDPEDEAAPVEVFALEEPAARVRLR